MSHHNLTSSTLIESLRLKEDQGWQRFVDLYGQTIYSWCRSARLDDHDIADVIQETYRAVAVGIGRFERNPERQGSFTAWLWKVTQSKIQTHRHRFNGKELARGGSDALQFLGEVADPIPSADTQSIADDPSILICAVETIRTEFTDTTWQAFWRVVVDEQPTDVIANQLGISAAAVRQANYRVRRRLRQELKFFRES